MMRRYFFAMLCVATLGGLMSVDTPTLQAYTLTSYDGGRTLTRWPSNEMDWEINATFIPYLDDDVDAMVAAMRAWEEVDCANINVTYDGTTTANSVNYPFGGFDGTNRVAFVEGQNWPADASNALAVTVSNVGNTRRESDLAFNGNYTWITAQGGGGIDVQGVATHEFGHYFGIGHSEVSNMSTMWFQNIGTGFAARSLELDDELALCFLYPIDLQNAFACERNSDCPLVETVNALGNREQTQMACTPEGVCELGPEAVVRTFGEPCENSSECGPGQFCGASGSLKRCTQTCDPDGEPCPGNFDCTRPSALSPEDICWPRGVGNLRFGEACDFSSECATNLCIYDPESTDGRGICSIQCEIGSTSCPQDFVCAPSSNANPLLPLPSDPVCQPPGDGMPGEPCTSFLDCADGNCITDNSGSFCRQTCTADVIDSGCPDGTACITTLLGPACLNGGETAIGDACTGPLDCSTLLCLPRTDDLSICTQRCDDANPCPEGFNCQFFGVGQSFCIEGMLPEPELMESVADMSAGGGMGTATDTSDPNGGGADMLPTDATSGEDEGCGCQTVTSPTGTRRGPVMLLLLGMVCVVWRRRRAR